MKIWRVYSGDDGESHLEEVTLQFTEGDGKRTVPHTSSDAAVTWALRTEGDFADFHNGPARQWVFYMTCAVEIGIGDGTVAKLDSGDVLLEEDATGRGHTTRVTKSGVCAFVRLQARQG